MRHFVHPHYILLKIRTSCEFCYKCDLSDYITAVIIPTVTTCYNFVQYIVKVNKLTCLYISINVTVASDSQFQGLNTYRDIFHIRHEHIVAVLEICNGRTLTSEADT